jgi:hypothetical protein
MPAPIQAPQTIINRVAASGRNWHSPKWHTLFGHWVAVRSLRCPVDLPIPFLSGRREPIHPSTNFSVAIFCGLTEAGFIAPVRGTMNMLQQLSEARCAYRQARQFAEGTRPSRSAPFIYKVRHSDAEHFQIVIRTYINPADTAVLSGCLASPLTCLLSCALALCPTISSLPTN